MSRTANSLYERTLISVSDWRARAARVTPNGSQTRSKVGLFDAPVAVVRAKGSQVWDLYGRQYTDWISALCAVTLGYGYPDVDEAVHRQIRDAGVSFPLSTVL
ncbi:MAG TPA: aminotransferase class III-fold pyridoxal phosphate-dependent enzyme, partial [Gemmatimonadales bacterium]|nr:aminotransferase class III-fold pyridoxal phosphate-dependent enzyme [Gemmatimonadales bacterium]